MAKSKKTLMTVALTLFVLASCEGYYSFQGSVRDKVSRQSLDSIEVYFIINEHDTMKLSSHIIIRDSLSPQKRIERRKNGDTDNYSGRDEQGFYKYEDTLVHSNGSFYIATPLISTAKGCPVGRLIFHRRGYKPSVIIVDSLENKNLGVFLESL